MAELVFAAEADEILNRMEADEAQRICAGLLNAALEILEADPGDARNRRRRFQTIGLWGISVVCGDEEWLIVREQEEDLIVVHHIVPAP